MSDKAYTWDKRFATKVMERGGTHWLYFFRKSFDDCTGVAMKALAHDMITASEKKYEVVHTSEAQALIAKNAVEPLNDPLLKAIFGPSNHLEQKALLDYYEKNAMMHSDKDGMAFVDLCAILGELERAEKFAERGGKDYEILKVLKESNGELHSEVLRRESCRMWLERASKNIHAARLSSLVHRLAGSANGESLLRVTSELWGEGFYWDALCFVAILKPDDSVLDFMKENISRFLKHKECSVLLDIVNTFKSADINKEGPVTIYDNGHLKLLDACTVFRLVKIDICRNEKDTESDVEKLGVRNKCSEAVRFVLLTALAQLGPVEAKTMAEDLVGFLKTHFPQALSDYFPTAEKILFEDFIGMVADLYSAVSHALGFPSSSTVDFEKAPNSGITNVIMAKWREDYTDIWASGGVWRRSSFANTCHGLLNHLASLEHILGASNDTKSKMLKFTLRTCWLFAAPDFNATKAYVRTFSSIAEDFGFNKEQVNTLSKAFAYVDSKVVPVTPTAVHLTPDELFNNIKSQGVQTPPLPTEVVPVAEVRPAPETVVAVTNETAVEEDKEEKPKEAVKAEEEPQEPIEKEEVQEETKAQEEVQEMESATLPQEKEPEPVPQTKIESQEVVASGVQRVVARENIPFSGAPQHASPAFNAVSAAQPPADLGKAVPIVSEDGVHLTGVLEEMETKWEAPRDEIDRSLASSTAARTQTSQESVTPLAEGTVTARSQTEEKEQFGRDGSFASRTADWNSVKQQSAPQSVNTTIDDAPPIGHSTPVVSQESLPAIRAPPPSPAEMAVASACVSVTAIQEGLDQAVFSQSRLEQALPTPSECSVDQKTEPPSDPTPPSATPAATEAPAPAPNALDSLLDSCSMKASGDARSVVATSAGSSSSCCPEDIAGAKVSAVRDHGVNALPVSPSPAFKASPAPLMNAPAPIAAAPPKLQQFNIGGFDQGSAGGFGGFGTGYNNGGGGDRRAVGFGPSSIPSGSNNRFSGGGGHHGGPGGRSGGGGGGGFHGGNGGHHGGGGGGYGGRDGGRRGGRGGRNY